MLLTLDDKHKEHLTFLFSVTRDVMKEFCNISLEFIEKGSNPKMYQKAASKLGVESSVVQQSVEGLMYLFTESARHLLNDLDFHDSMLALGFSEGLTEELLEYFQRHRTDIRHILGQMSMSLPHYDNLEWRLDIQLASRTLRHQIEPQILLRLGTQDGDVTKSHVMQTDPVNLIHLTQSLEEALKELKSSHCRRILRNI